MSTRIPRDFVPLDVNYPRDPAIRKAGPDAELLYLRGLAFAKQANTDGVIYDYDLDVVGVGLPRLAARRDALVREGLWETTDDGWHIRSWTRWNQTEEEKAEVREKKRQAAIRTNHKRYHGDDPDPECPHCKTSGANPR